MRSMSEEESRYSSEAEKTTAGARQTREEKGADKTEEETREDSLQETAQEKWAQGKRRLGSDEIKQAREKTST